MTFRPLLLALALTANFLSATPPDEIKSPPTTGEPANPELAVKKGKNKKNRSEKPATEPAATPLPSLVESKKGRQGKNKDGALFVPGQPMFTPDKNTPVFEPTKVTPDHLDPEQFKVPDDLEVTLWAASPQLFNPTNMDTDAAGRIWVTEGVNYRHHSGRNPDGDCVRVLQDTDGDGRCDSSEVFVREKVLEAPLGIAVFDNVIFVSCAPSIIKYTDVNRNLKFDPGVDKREVFLTGFEKPQHDHSLHSVYAGPDGRLYFSNGNCGGNFTDKSGKTFRIGSGYLKNPYTGEKSDDGRVYVGGFTASMDPTGRDVRILGYNYRNSYEGVRTSIGDMFLSDNDDPPACRTSHLIEGGNFGFFSADGHRMWRADKRPGQTVPQAEWRQDDPGSLPAGDVYGGGAPTGMAFYENGALDEKWNGLLLSCETGRNVVFGYQPKADGAGMTLDRANFFTSNDTGAFSGSDFVGGAKNIGSTRRTLFRPSDVCVGADGAIYVTDWFDPRTGGHGDLDETCSGAIYRIAPKGFKSIVPKINFDTVAGQITALKSPANNVRHVAFMRLKAEGKSSVPAVLKLRDDRNPYIAARAEWLLAQLGPEGRKAAGAWLSSKDDAQRLVALRALRAASAAPLDLLSKMAGDKAPAVRREVAVSMRDVPAPQSVPILSKLASKLDGADRSAVEAWGIGCSGKESAVWDAIKPTGEWTDTFARIAWRLHPANAVPELQARAANDKLSPAQRKLALDSLAFIPEATAAKAVLALAKDKTSPIVGDTLWWLIKRSTDDWASFGIAEELKTQGIFDPDTVQLVSIVTPPAIPTPYQVEDVLKLKGDAQRGAAAAARCIMCHQIKGQGAEFGPGLDGWGRSQTPEVIAQALIDPSKEIAHGYEGEEIVTKDGVTIHGMVLTDGAFMIVRSMGGQTQYIPKSRIKSRNKLSQSMMMSATQLGLSAQEVADIVAYLQSGK